VAGIVLCHVDQLKVHLKLCCSELGPEIRVFDLPSMRHHRFPCEAERNTEVGKGGTEERTRDTEAVRVERMVKGNTAQ
jgi:hypothetical protein